MEKNFSGTLYQFLNVPLLLGITLLLTGCLGGGDLGKGDSGSGSTEISDAYIGCIEGTGIDASRIQLSFEFPSNANRVNIYRNGLKVYSSSNPSNLSFIDVGLVEGAEYEYSCEMERSQKTKLGSKIVVASTVSTSPPIFAGILTATSLSATTAKLTWAVPSSSGPLAKTYAIYGNPGSTVNWSGTPRSTLSAGSNTLTLTALGDQLTYSFGVRACTASNVCDSNTVKITITMPDNGAPTTNGIQSFTANNSTVTLVAPWVEANGLIAKRKVYSKMGAPAPTSIADMTLIRTEVIADPTAPTTSLVINGIVDNTIYYYVIRDEDSLTQSNNNFVVVTVNSGDMTPPVFTGITSLSQGAPPQSTLVAGFNAIARQGIESSDGASHYVVYTTSVAYPGTPANACSSGTLLNTVSSASYAPGAATINLSALSERTTYAVCLKAKDSSGNTSATTSYLTATTKDVTAPMFDGIQSMAFNSTDSSVQLSWNASPSTDVSLYRIQIWKNTANPTAGQITTIDRTASSSPTGFKVTQSSFTYGNGDVIYSVVNACDDAAAMPGGTQNCTTWATASSKSVTLPNFLPPQGFLGIMGSASQASTTEGNATISWYAPTWTSDYYGFRIYTVNAGTGQLDTLVKTCTCAVPGSCTNVDTSCTITGLNPARLYRFHVRAINSSSFETDYLSPSTSYADLTVIDQTAPSFNSGLNVGAAPTYTLYWNTATDNQYTGAGAQISYQVYRKAGSTFATPTNPAADGGLRTTTTNLNFTDSGFVDGTTYYYSVCAVDVSNNKKCDGTVVSFVTVDTTPPSLTSFTTDKENYSPLKKWSLSWTMSDVVTSTNLLRVKIYQSITTSAPVDATTSDTLIFDQVGMISLSNLQGPTNVKRYINYLLVITDQAGNSVTKKLSISSDNRVTVTKVKRETGLLAGGEWVVIDGTGFSNSTNNGFATSTNITINDNNCTSLSIVSDERILCKTPAGGVGAAVVKAINPDGSIASQSGLFSYVSTSSEICDNPGTWGPEVATGTGSAGAPFVLCTPDHVTMMSVRTGATKNYLQGGFYYKLGANIDFAGFTPTVIGSSTYAFVAAQIDGDGYSILNYNLTNTAMTTADNRCTFIHSLGGSTFAAKNLRFINQSFNCLMQSGQTSAISASMFVYSVNHGSVAVGLENLELYGSMTVGPTNLNQIGAVIGNNSAITCGKLTDISGLVVNANINIDSSGSNVTNFSVFGGAMCRMSLVNSKITLNYKNYKPNNSDYFYGIGDFYNSNTNSAINLNIDNLKVDISADGAMSSLLFFNTYINSAITPAPQFNVTKLTGRYTINKNFKNATSARGTIAAIPNCFAAATVIYNFSSWSLDANLYTNYVGTGNYGLFTGTGYSAGSGTSFGMGSINLTDMAIRGGVYNTGNAPTTGSFALHGADTIMNVTRYFQVGKFTSVLSSKYFATIYGGATTNFAGTFWDYVYAQVGDTDGGLSGAGITAATTTQMTNQATGNIYETAGYDFTPGTGKWKWCPLENYPRLSFEACP